MRPKIPVLTDHSLSTRFNPRYFPGSSREARPPGEAAADPVRLANASEVATPGQDRVVGGEWKTWCSVLLVSVKMAEI